LHPGFLLIASRFLSRAIHVFACALKQDADAPHKAGVESFSSFMSMLALNLHDHPDSRRIVARSAAA
jgi:hypothetical protein